MEIVLEQRQYLQHFHKRSWPAVCEYQWNGSFVRRPLMDEMDSDSIDLHPEMPKAVQPFLFFTPVEFVDPVVHQFMQVFALRSVSPIVSGNRAGPSCPAQSLLQVVKHRLRKVDPEFFDFHIASYFATTTKICLDGCNCIPKITTGQ